jgi:hypothetical protein
MKIGTGDRKKLGVLAGLLLVLVYFLWPGSGSDQPAPAPRARVPNAQASVQPLVETQPRPPLRPGARAQDSRFKFGLDRAADPMTVDPTLRLDLLDKLHAVTLAGGDRNLFQFAAAPLPKTPEAKIVPKMLATLAAKPAPPEVNPQAPPPKPQAPPVPLKFYGYISPARAGQRRAFFLDGDDIVVAGEGETIKLRYKVIRISINSVVVEDTQFRSEQTLRLEEQPG